MTWQRKRPNHGHFTIELPHTTSSHNSLNSHRILKMTSFFGILKERAIDRDQPRISPSIRLEMRAS